MLTHITLKSRSMQLCALVQNAQCTDGDGQALCLDDGVDAVSELLKQTQRDGGNVYLVGNGGSAAIASHVANDFCNVAGLRATAMLDHSALTCFANDYGYESVFSERISRMSRVGDVLVAISSSGQSPNIIAAAKQMRSVGGRVLTFSGFDNKNRLRHLGMTNFWIDSDDYGLVEVGHLFMLHHVVDKIRLTWAGHRA